MNITWLASYPKSGNTWLRFFLGFYLYGTAQDSKDISKRIPDIHRTPHLDEDTTGTLLCKTHALFNEHHPYFNETSGIIYLLRHPKDILLSGYNFQCMTGRVKSSEKEFALDFIKDLGLRKWRDNGYGSWPEHIHSWLDNHQQPLLVLRYEDMLDKPEENFSKALEFIGATIDENRFRLAIRQSSFEGLRQLEDQERNMQQQGIVFGPNRGDSSRRFINKGESIQSLRHISEEVDVEFDKCFEPVLRETGYL